MSQCCAGCAHNKGCNLRTSFVGSPSMAWGLAGLMGGTTLAAGSHFRQGFQLNPTYTCDTVYSITGATSVKDQIEGCLYSTGNYTNITASCTAGFTTIHPYLLIEGDTYSDFAQASDLTGNIIDTLKNCVTAVDFVNAINTVDTLQIDSIPQTVAQNPNYQQPTTGPGSLYQIQQQAQAQAKPSACPPGYVDKGWFSVDCQLAGSGPDLTSIGLGAAAVILFVLFVKR